MKQITKTATKNKSTKASGRQYQPGDMFREMQRLVAVAALRREIENMDYAFFQLDPFAGADYVAIKREQAENYPGQPVDNELFVVQALNPCLQAKTQMGAGACGQMFDSEFFYITEDEGKFLFKHKRLKQ
jgi:hypothetical protein